MTVERWAWDEFWRDQQLSGRACLNRAPYRLRTALDGHWRSVAANFRPRARVLDLGCGNGALGRQLTSTREDIYVDGIDYADVTATIRNDRVAIHGGVAIEAPPFGDASFDGAVSQFGFEYCQVDAGVRQVARVLKPGAPVALLVHHAHSPIARDNRSAGAALHCALSPAIRGAFLAADRRSLERLLADIPSPKWPDPTLSLLIEALRKRIGMSANDRALTWSAITDALAPELALIAALDRSGVAHCELAQWLDSFDGLFDMEEAEPLVVDGQPFAWRIFGHRSLLSCAGHGA